MKWVVYEVWTTARVIEAATEQEAHDKGEPPAREGLNLSNWHVIPLSADEPKKDPNAYKPWGSRYQNPGG
jgi:hypothetical protein